MKLFIIRHGEKENDEFDSNLTDLGKNQVLKISNELKEKNICKIYSSTNPRSIQTGQIIHQQIKVPLIIVNSIKELPKEIFFQSEIDWNNEYKQLILNINLFLSEIVKNNEDVILSLHAGINRAIFSILLDIPLKKTIHFSQDIACLNVLEFKEIYGEKRWCFRLINSTHHLK